MAHAVSAEASGRVAGRAAAGRPRTVTDADVEAVLTRTPETTPADATHWSTRTMAQACGLSRNTVHRIWRAFALQPHRTETFKLSKDSLFISSGCIRIRYLI